MTNLEPLPIAPGGQRLRENGIAPTRTEWQHPDAMPIPPQHRPARVVRSAPSRTVADRRRRRSAQGPGGLILGFVLTVGAFGILLAALAANNKDREAGSAPRKAAATAQSPAYDRMLAEIVKRIKTSPSVDVLLANRATFHEEINDSTTLTGPQKESLRWEIIREMEAKKEAMAKASFQR